MGVLTIVAAWVAAGLGQVDVSPRLATARETHEVPAIAAVVVREGNVVARGVDGVRRAGDETPATIDDLWHLGSCTKAMTAALTATFVDEGVIAWETTLEEALPDLRDSMHADFRHVTIRQLLAHRAGIPSDLGFDGLWGRLWNHKGTPQEQRWLLTTEVLARKPEHTPGTAFLYANAGYSVVGSILERRTGKPWETLIRERLAEPLGMTAFGFGAPGVRGKADQPRGHEDRGKPVEPGPGSDNPPAIGPGGTCHASLDSWAKFIAMQVSGVRGESDFLTPDSFVALSTPAPGEDYALGWGVTTRPWARGEGGTGRVLTHAGSNTMWFAVAWLAPEKDLAILVVCNRGGDRAAQACDAVASALVGEFAK